MRRMGCYLLPAIISTGHLEVKNVRYKIREGSVWYANVTVIILSRQYVLQRTIKMLHVNIKFGTLCCLWRTSDWKMVVSFQKDYFGMNYSGYSERSSHYETGRQFKPFKWIIVLYMVFFVWIERKLPILFIRMFIEF